MTDLNNLTMVTFILLAGVLAGVLMFWPPLMMCIMMLCLAITNLAKYLALYDMGTPATISLILAIFWVVLGISYFPQL